MLKYVFMSAAETEIEKIDSRFKYFLYARASGA